MLDGGPRYRGWLVVAICAVACTKSNPDATCADGTCMDPEHPYCDFDGAVSGTAGACIAVSCTPGDVKECSGSDALTCNATGDSYELGSCTLGCSSDPAPHCKYIQPKYAPDACDTPAQGSALTIASSGMFDPNLDANCTGGVIAQAGAAGLCVVHYAKIDIAAGSTFTVTGYTTALGSAAPIPGRALALIADGTLSVEGTLDVSGHTGMNGPGGGTYQSGGFPQSDGANTGGQEFMFCGGGGAGGATAGAPGGCGNISGSGNDGSAANGGVVVMNPATLTVLVGGASSANVSGTELTSIGGGGGAVALISCRASVVVSGVIDGGGGGGGGGFVPLIPVSGFGGGAGGDVVVQGVGVEISGSLFANGGGGGGGGPAFADSTITTGVNGADGPMSDIVGAAGGAQLNAANGGEGGYLGGAPTDGRKATSQSTSGGGGGSVGFLQTYTPAGVTPTLSPAHASPALQPNGTIETK